MGSAATAAQQQQQGRVLVPGVATNILISGIGVSFGTTVTNPIDVIKTRLQLQPAVCGTGSSNPGMVSTGVLIVRQEGVLRLWAGWRPAVTRAMLYGGLRFGLYTPMKNAISSFQQQQQQGIYSSSLQDSLRDSSHASSNTSSSLQQQQQPGPSSSISINSRSMSSSSSSSSSNSSSSSGAQAGVAVKLLAGTASGALAAALLSPTELVKVRLQQPGSPYSSSSAVIAAVLRSDGVRGLWKGATPGVVRAAALTASQCATYDEVKSRVMAATGWPDNALTHLATALITGVVSTTATNPVDVVKTYMFVGGSQYRNPLSCASAIHSTHGLAGFWRGWLANYARLGPQTVMTFLVVEQLRHAAGLQPL